MRKIITSIFLLFGIVGLGFCEELDESFFYGKWRDKQIGNITLVKHKTETAEITVYDIPLPSLFEFREDNIGFWSLGLQSKKTTILWSYSPEERLILVTFPSGNHSSLAIFQISENKLLSISRESLSISIWERLEE